MKLDEIEFGIHVLRPSERDYILIEFSSAEIDYDTVNSFGNRLTELCPDVKFIMFPNWVDKLAVARRGAVQMLLRQLEKLTGKRWGELE